MRGVEELGQRDLDLLVLPRLFEDRQVTKNSWQRLRIGSGTDQNRNPSNGSCRNDVFACTAMQANIEDDGIRLHCRKRSQCLVARFHLANDLTTEPFDHVLDQHSDKCFVFGD